MVRARVGNPIISASSHHDRAGDLMEIVSFSDRNRRFSSPDISLATPGAAREGSA
jgi:hypothetical protein